MILCIELTVACRRSRDSCQCDAGTLAGAQKTEFRIRFPHAQPWLWRTVNRTLSITVGSALEDVATGLCLSMLDTRISLFVGVISWWLFVDGLLVGTHIENSLTHRGDTKLPCKQTAVFSSTQR